MLRVISEPSLPFSPVISGTACCRPARYIASGSSGMTQPSTLGAQTLPVRRNGLPASALDAANTSVALAARIAARASSVFPVIPSAVATRRPSASAASQPRAASASGRSQPLIQLLWAMAPWNSPSACGMSMTDMTRRRRPTRRRSLPGRDRRRTSRCCRGPTRGPPPCPGGHSSRMRRAATRPTGPGARGSRRRSGGS